MPDFQTIIDNYGPALLALLASLAMGAAIDALTYRFITRRSRHQGWRLGVALAKALHGLPTALGLLLGLFLALQRIPMVDTAWRVLSGALTVLSIIIVTAFAARILGRVVRVITDRDDVRLPSSSIFVNLAKGLVWVLGAMSLLAALGVSIAPLLTALGVGGLAVGLALQPTLENVFSGVQVLASRQIEPGDLIRLETGEEGTVLDVTWRNTTIRRPSNEVVIVPNAVIGRSRVTNFSSLDPTHVFTLSVPVPLTVDVDTIERIATEVAEEVVAEVDGAVRNAEPSVRFAAYVPPNATLNVTVRCHSYPDRILVRHELIRRLQIRFAEEGVDTAAAGPAAPPPGTT